MQALQGSAAAGFTAAQLSELVSYTACAGITIDVFSNITVPAMAGITDNCIKYISEISFRDVTAAQIGGLNPFSSSGFTKAQMIAMPAAAVHGFNSSQVQHFVTYTACAGITNDTLAAFTTQAMSGFTSDCVRSMEDDAFQSASRQQISAIAPLAAAGFTKKQMMQFNVEAVQGFTAAQTSEWVGYTACAGIGGLFMNHLTSAAVSGVTSGCISYMLDDAFSMVNATQVASLSVNSTKGLTKKQAVQFNGAAAAGFSAVQISQVVSYMFCAGMNVDTVDNLTTAAMAGFSSSCVDAVPPESFARITAAQMSNMTDNGISGFTKQQAAFFPPTASTGLSTGQLKSFTNYKACQTLPPAFISNIPVQSFSGFTSDCIHNALDDAFSLASIDQMNRIESCAAFTARQVAALSAPIFGALNGACLTNLTISRITAEQIEALSPTACSFLSLRQMQLELNDTTARAFNLTQIDSFTLDAVAGLSGDFYGNLTQKYGLELLRHFPLSRIAIRYMTAPMGVKEKILSGVLPPLISWSDLTKNLPQATWLELAMVDLSNLPSEIGSDVISYLANTTTAGLRSDQVRRLTKAALQQISPGQARYFLIDSFAALSGSQLADVAPQSLATMPLRTLATLNSQQISNLTAEQVAWLPEVVLSCSVVNQLSSSQTSLATGKQKESIDACAHRGGDTKPADTGSNKLAIILGSIAAVAGVVALAGFGYWYYKRHREQGYQAV